MTTTASSPPGSDPAATSAAASSSWAGPAQIADELADAGIVGIAVTFVDNSGVTRVKGIPVERLAGAAVGGIGVPPVLDAFVLDDSIAAVGSPIGDLRLIPDVTQLVALAAQPGWAWAPADRVEVDGSPYLGCQRSFARRMTERAAAEGLEVRMAWETEWIVDAGNGLDIVPATNGSAYGMSRLIDMSSYGRDLLEAFAAQGIDVEQLHPEYAPSQMEVSVSPLDPVGAADRVVLVRLTIRAVASEHGYRVSFSPALVPDGVGSGAHVHLSIWRDGINLLAPVGPLASPGAGPSSGAGTSSGAGLASGAGSPSGAAPSAAAGAGSGLDPVGEAWVAGLLDALPALLAVGAPSVASYLRLQPQRWAAPWRCWGRENREAALRLVTGSAHGASANLEVKVFDASSNPYLVAGAVIAAGLDGVARGLRLPAEATVDPASLDDAAREAAGITRLATNLTESIAAFEASEVIKEAMGPALAATWTAVRNAEIARFADASDAEVAETSRWVW